jgi:probable HAF family extracellular repeat protein
MKPRLIFVAVVCLGLVSWRHEPPLSASEAPVYEIDDLGSVGGNFTLPSDINDAGDVVGTVQTATFDFHAFLYTDATGLRDLGTFGGDHWSQAYTINNYGHMTVSRTNRDNSLGAFLYGDDIGAIPVTGLPGAVRVLVAGVNDADQVTGTSVATDTSQTFVWTAATGAQPIASPGNVVFSGGAINIHGQIALSGQVNTDPFVPLFHAFRFTPDLGMLDLATLPGSGRIISVPSSINADGDVVGYFGDASGGSATQAFVYTNRRGMIALGNLGGRQTQANYINDNGAIVGDATPPGSSLHAFLYTPASGVVDLNSLIDSTSGWSLWRAAAINNRGMIVGIGGFGGGVHGYRLRRVRDDSAPDIEAIVSPAPNAAGWNNSPVTVRWSVRDPESGIASSSGCETQALRDDTTGTSFTCNATNSFGGSSSQSVTVRIDRTPPKIDAAVSPQPNAAGWNNSDVTVTWSVRDPETGIVSSSGCDTQTLTNETGGLTLTCNATNGAGESSFRSVTVRIDTTPPVLTCAATPALVWPPNGQMVPVSISVDVADALSGPAGFSLLSYMVSDPDAGPNAVTAFSVGAPSSSGLVEALRRGNGDARVYTFAYRGLDVAGLAGSCTATVVVPHDSKQ